MCDDCETVGSESGSAASLWKFIAFARMFFLGRFNGTGSRNLHLKLALAAFSRSRHWSVAFVPRSTRMQIEKFFENLRSARWKKHTKQRKNGFSFLLEQAAGERNQYIKIHYSFGLNSEEEVEEVEAETVTKKCCLEKASPKVVQLCRNLVELLPKPFNGLSGFKAVMQIVRCEKVPFTKRKI